jgi:hypothetical protein
MTKNIILPFVFLSLQPLSSVNICVMFQVSFPFWKQGKLDQIDT